MEQEIEKPLCLPSPPPKKKKFQPQKYDWDKLKIEFLDSEHKMVEKWLREKGIKSNGNTWKKTAGWTEEKKRMVCRAVEKTKEKLVEALVDNSMDRVKKRLALVDVGLELALERVVDALKRNEEVFIDSEGGIHTTMLSPRGITQLANSLKTSMETHKLSINEGGDGNGDSNRAVIRAEVLERIRRIQNARGTS